MESLYENHSSINSSNSFKFDYRDYIYDDPIHWHENLEILYFYKGNCSVLSGTEEFQVTKGDIIVINSKDIHSVKCKNTHASYCCLIIDFDFCEQMDFSIKNTFFRKKIRDNRLSECFEKMIEEKKNKDNFYRNAQRILIQSILLLLFRDYTSDSYPNDKSSNKVNITKTIIRYLRANYKYPITVEDIENNCEYTRFYFSRVFKDITGMPIMTYLNELRIKEAKALLAKTDMDVNKISEECGFDNQSYFGKVFKKYVGCSPLEFRKSEQIW